MTMKQIKYMAATLLIFFVMAVVFLMWIFSGERPKSYFSNYKEAKASGIMDRGWIPTFIPKSATNINEQHDLDTNWVKMTFNYAPDDIDITRLTCNSELVIENGIEFKCEYFSSNVIIRLFEDGKAELHSSPN